MKAWACPALVVLGEDQGRVVVAPTVHARYNAQVFIDECHATGFFGPSGRGTDEYCGVQGRIDVSAPALGAGLTGLSGSAGPAPSILGCRLV
jgi:7-keto-8-aminopelargonate synthetase-like enzyme